MKLTPTAEQQAIIDFGRSSFQSMLLNALAGAAKTSTLVMLAHSLPLQPILCIAFNKRIAEEMQKRMPSHVKCQTLNSLGHGVWAKVVGKRLTLDTSKTYDLVKDETDRLKGEEKSEAKSQMGSIMKGIGIAKASGFVPKSFASIATSLAEGDDALYDLVAPAVDDEPTLLMLRLITVCLERSIKAAYAGIIDFDDQIYMSTLFGGVFPRYPVVMVDEAQDLSPLNHVLLEKLQAPRLIAVGDPWQSIYGFRGAHRNGMQALKEKFSMHELTLSVSFRCPISAVKRAHFRVPHFKWCDWAEEGSISRLEEWGPDDVPENAFIICRNNAPLFGAALRLIRGGRGVELVGRELGPGLIKVLKKLGPDDLKQEQVLVAIKAWEVEQLAKAKEARHSSIRDRAECLRVFAEFGANLFEAISYAEHLFSSAGTIKLMSGHKAKGLETDDVIHLDPWRIPSKFACMAADAGDHSKLDQELNLRYVIETRWKKRLFLADLEKMK